MTGTGSPLPLVSPRKMTRRIQVGGLAIGDGTPISVQSMVKVPTTDVEGSLDQIRRAKAAGAEIMRVAVFEQKQLQALRRICGGSAVPVVADIHFRPELALSAMDAGVACVRVNPSTLGGPQHLETVGKAAVSAGVAVRVGLNAARLECPESELPDRLVAAALEAVRPFEEAGVRDLKVSLKASRLWATVEANRRFSGQSRLPLHLGLTEAGPVVPGLTKSVAALTLLLCDGIGDTLRVSLAGDPVTEVLAGRALLRTLGLSDRGVDLVACPSCGRAHQAVAEAAGAVQEALLNLAAGLSVAVMGCEVNGPGEARAADVGIAGTASGWVLFRAGRIVDRLGPQEGPLRLIQEARALAAGGKGTGEGRTKDPAGTEASNKEGG